MAHHSFATDRHEARLAGGRIELKALNAGTSLDGRASVLDAPVLLDDGNVLELVGADAEGSEATGLAKEIVARVLDHQTDVRVAGKVDASLDVPSARCVEDVDGVSAQRAAVAVESGINRQA